MAEIPRDLATVLRSDPMAALALLQQQLAQRPMQGPDAPPAPAIRRPADDNLGLVNQLLAQQPKPLDIQVPAWLKQQDMRYQQGLDGIGHLIEQADTGMRGAAAAAGRGFGDVADVASGLVDDARARQRADRTKDDAVPRPVADVTLPDAGMSDGTLPAAPDRPDPLRQALVNSGLFRDTWAMDAADRTKDDELNPKTMFRRDLNKDDDATVTPNGAAMADDGGLPPVAPKPAATGATLADNAKAAAATLRLQKADTARGGDQVTGATPKAGAPATTPDADAWTAPGQLGDWQTNVRSKFGLDGRGSNKLGVALMLAGGQIAGGHNLGDAITAGVLGYQAAADRFDRSDDRKAALAISERQADRQDAALDMERDKFEWEKQEAARSRLQQLGTPLEQAIKAATVAQQATALGVGLDDKGGYTFIPTTPAFDPQSDVGKLRADAAKIAGRGATAADVEKVYQGLLADQQKIKGNAGLGGF